MTRWLIALALAGVSIASAKTYSITLSEPYVMGSTTVKPGDYHLKLQGSEALLLTESNKTAAEAPVKVEDQTKKFDETAVISTTVGNQRRIEDIELGGTRMKLKFN